MAGLRGFQRGAHWPRKSWTKLLLLGVLSLLWPCVRPGGAPLPALSPVPGVVEVWQAEDGELLVPSQADGEPSQDGLPPQESSSFYVPGVRALHFQPSTLQFGAQPLGLPRAETVYVHNPSQELPVTLISMFTSSRHFHMPALQRRVIPPRGRLSFRVIFLPTEEGSVENSLFINTSSHGVLSYQVSGVGVQHEAPNKPSLLLFPHIQSIKLTQSQEDAANVSIMGLQLECSLPNQSTRHPQGLCFRTEQKLSVQISLLERGEHRHADLEKMKQYVQEHTMVLFLISTGHGWEPQINIYVLNSGFRHLHVKEMQLLSRGGRSLRFQPMSLGASAANFTRVASLICGGASLIQERKYAGHVFQVLGSYTLKTYPAFHIADRRPGYDPPTLFHIRQKQSGGGLADLWLTNSFNFSFSVSAVSLSPELGGLLKVLNFSGPLLVPPGCWKVLSLQLSGSRSPLSVLTRLALLTSVGVSLQLPLHIRSTVSQGDVLFEASGGCGSPCQLAVSEAGAAKWHQTLLLDSSTWRGDSRLAAELSSRWRRTASLSCSWPRLPMETGLPLDFGATPLNESKVKFFPLRNPSSSPITVQLLTLSSYPAALEALDLLTKWFKINPLSVNVTTVEFTLVPGGRQDPRTLKASRGSRVLQLRLQPWEVREVGVVFTPSEHKPLTSIILIRNNLTVLDMVLVTGQGARELLRVGGKLPGPSASLRFNVPQSTLMECRDGLKTSKPLFAIRKSFKVENAGELPLTVVSMNINGYKCQGFGFEVLDCRSFQLDYNSSSEINIAFTPDFTSSWVIRELALVTARGSSFPFTLNVTLPHHMLPLCAQALPGPSWEDSFWVITIVFTCISLGGVCLMAIRQAQYILSEFVSPGARQNHPSVLTRDNSPVDTISPGSMSKVKGSCKTFVDSFNMSDKSKGKGSLPLAPGPARTQAPAKKIPAPPLAPQRKHKVSVYYGKYRVNPAAATAAPLEEDYEPHSDGPTPEPGANPCAPEPPAPAERRPPPAVDTEPAPAMFPMETHCLLPETQGGVQAGRAGLLVCSVAQTPCPDNAPPSPCGPRSSPCPQHSPQQGPQQGPQHGCRTDGPGTELRDNSHARRKHSDKSEASAAAGGKSRRNCGKSRRKNTEGGAGVPQPSVALLSEKSREPEWRDPRNPTRPRNRCSAAKADGPRAAPSSDIPGKHMYNGRGAAARARRRGPERRPLWESGSDSGSSSGSVPASRGSWGSWSSASSLEGEREQQGTYTYTTTPPKRREAQHSACPSERDCCQTDFSSLRTPSQYSLYRKEPCQSPLPPAAPCFTPSFADVAAGLERNTGVSGPYSAEEMWSTPSIPLTNDFRYNATESQPCVPPGSALCFYNGFPWSSANSQCTSHPPYCDQRNYCSLLEGNTFSCPETPGSPYAPPPGWSEAGPQDVTSAWDSTGHKPFFSGTRSLSPMSGLFGSIWTPQSEPPQSPFHAVRPPPPQPLPGAGRPKQYSSFNPFGPHMHLDIWNSCSSRSSTSQLSNDSGFGGDL
ncbi:transmembrane protein 131-like isoform X2 [Amia ocellicauda]|uniref:transmembrane protein 131-like isoform X2 n=1 Tax=Amia ocellicauda TaxID=2972642 RepID=UPI0034643FD7